MPSPDKSALYKAVDRAPDLSMYKKFSQGGGGGAHAGMIRWNKLDGVCANMCMDFHRALSQGVHKQWLNHTFTPAFLRLQGASEFAIRLETLQNFSIKANAEDPMFSATREKVRDQSTFTTPTGTATHLYDTEEAPPTIDAIASLINDYLNKQSDIDSLANLSKTVPLQQVFDRLSASDEVLKNEDLHFTLQINFENPVFSHAVAITKNPYDKDTLFILDPNVGIIEAPKTQSGLKKALETLVTSTYPEPKFKIDSYNLGLQLPHWFAGRKDALLEDEILKLQVKERNLFGNKDKFFTTNKTDYTKIYRQFLTAEQNAVGRKVKEQTITMGDGDEWDILVYPGDPSHKAPGSNETHDDETSDEFSDIESDETWTLLELDGSDDLKEEEEKEEESSTFKNKS